MSELKIEPGSLPAEKRFSITVTEKGPFLVYGRPPFCEQFIMPDPDNESWYFQEGKHFSTESEPTALCRCGASKHKPYCDGAHVHADWDPQLTAPDRRLLDDAEQIEGGTLRMSDNPAYCVFARFCHPYDFRFEPSLGLIEDIAIGSSGGLWIRGGIPLRREDGTTYEIRNRVVVCRCGQSANKPYCDGTHAAIKWRDDLQGDPGRALPKKYIVRWGIGCKPAPVAPEPVPDRTPANRNGRPC